MNQAQQSLVGFVGGSAADIGRWREREGTGLMATASLSKSNLKAETAFEFKLIFFVVFLYFLVISLACRLMPKAWRPESLCATADCSVFGQARAFTRTAVPFAFMR